MEMRNLFSGEKAPLWENQTLILESEDRTAYYTSIIKIKDNTIYVQFPVNNQHVPMSLAKENRVSVNFFNELKERYMFDTYLTYDNKKIYFAQPAVGAIHKVQRRNYFRVPANLDFWLETAPESKSSFITDDISGGGIAFFCSKVMNFHEVVSGGIYLDKKRESSMIYFCARFIDIRTVSDAAQLVSMEFVGMKEPQRDKIIQYCLQRQIEIRNMEGQNVAARINR